MSLPRDDPSADPLRSKSIWRAHWGGRASARLRRRWIARRNRWLERYGLAYGWYPKLTWADTVNRREFAAFIRKERQIGRQVRA